MGDSSRRRIPEATVARLPLYYRALLETAEREVTTISSERLAELAGVNAAKVRKDLSYLGSYGTRGVGYDVEYLLHEISRSSASPATGRSSSSASATSAVRSPTTAASVPAAFGSSRSSTATPSSSASEVGDLVGRGRRRPRPHRRRARDRDRHPRDAGRASRRRSPTGSSPPASRRSSTSRPAVISVPDGVSLRKVDLAIELQILSFYQLRRFSSGVGESRPKRFP